MHWSTRVAIHAPRAGGRGAAGLLEGPRRAAGRRRRKFEIYAPIYREVQYVTAIQSCDVPFNHRFWLKILTARHYRYLNYRKAFKGKGCILIIPVQ